MINRGCFFPHEFGISVMMCAKFGHDHFHLCELQQFKEDSSAVSLHQSKLAHTFNATASLSEDRYITDTLFVYNILHRYKFMQSRLLYPS